MLFSRVAPYRHVFLLPFRQFVLVRVKSTILVASVRIKSNVLVFAGLFRRKVGCTAPSSVGAFAEGCLLEEQIPSFLVSSSFYHRCLYVTRATNSIFLAAEIGRINTAFFLFHCKGNTPFFSLVDHFANGLFMLSFQSVLRKFSHHISCLAIVARCREFSQCQIF